MTAKPTPKPHQQTRKNFWQARENRRQYLQKIKTQERLPLTALVLLCGFKFTTENPQVRFDGFTYG